MTAKDWLSKAQTDHFALGAFNAANIETLKAIVTAAADLHAPVIIEASHGEVEYIRPKNLVDIVRNAREETGLPIFTNLDHAPSLEAAREGIAAGFDLIHFNGSSLPYEDNVRQTQEIVAEAHSQNILVEAELNPIVGGSALHHDTAKTELAKGQLTDPNQAVDFINRTGVDTLAPAIGNLHGIYETDKILDLERLKQIRQQTSAFLSLHGGSSISPNQIQSAIDHGIVKINVNTELRVAFRQTLESTLKTNDEVAIYKLMPPVISSVQKIVEEKIKLFGSANKA